MIELLYIDCVEYLKKCENNQFDLAIVDPPYGIFKKNRGGAGKLKKRILNQQEEKVKKWDKKPSKEYWQQLFRVSKNQIIWGGNYFDLPPTRGIICWDKMQPWKNFSQIEYAWTSFDMPAQLFKYDNKRNKKIHPTQKPVQLYKWLLKTYAKPGDNIIDTHLGSGSIAIACHDYNYNLVGCENDKTHYKNLMNRYNNHSKQHQLFKSNTITHEQPETSSLQLSCKF